MIKIFVVGRSPGVVFYYMILFNHGVKICCLDFFFYIIVASYSPGDFVYQV